MTRHATRIFAALALVARGGRVIWLNPRRTETAKQVGEHHFIRPDTDVFFMLAFLHALIETDSVDEPRVNRTMTGWTTGTGNRLTSDGVWTYTHDDEGNRIKKSKGASLETWTYVYGHHDHLTGVPQRPRRPTDLVLVSGD